MAWRRQRMWWRWRIAATNGSSDGRRQRGDGVVSWWPWRKAYTYGSVAYSGEVMAW